MRRDLNFPQNKEEFKKPLHFTAEKGDVDIVRMLVKAGVDISCTTFQERSALYYAAIGGHENTAQQLLQAGIDAGIDASVADVISFWGSKRAEI